MKLPILSSSEIIKILKKGGFQTTRQKGSHICLHKKIDSGFKLVVVAEGKEIPIGTLKDILRKSGISREKLFELLDQIWEHFKK